VLKILFVNQPQSEYGQSFLYDGLRRLGHVVIDYPYNDRLHFTEKKECAGDCTKGPCAYGGNVGCTNHPAHLCWPNQKHLLDNPLFGAPDLIISNNGYGNESLHRFYAEHNTPIAALDLGDSLNSSYDAWTHVIGRPPDFFFRREYLEGQPGKPLSYSFYDDALAFEDNSKYTVSFMFRPTNPQRVALAEQIRAIPGSFVGEVSHSQYLDILSKSRFSVALKGAGYDSVRRWEIPCRGSVLCTDYAPIIINNDFVDGESCIKFKSADELVAKVNSYLNGSPEVYNTLRNNSFKHFKQFHTTTERARQFLKDCGFND